MSVTEDQFKALLAQLQITLTAEDSQVAALVTLAQNASVLLQVIVAAAQKAGVDLTSEAAQVQTITADIATQTTNVQNSVATINTALNPPAAS